MPEYRRHRVPGGTYFFTVVLRDRGADTLAAQAGLLGDAIRTVRARRPFRTDALVVLPNHLHCIWTLPPGDVAFAERWREVKTRFSQALPHQPGARRRERGVWQRRYWEHTIRDERDYAAHMDYVHFNPVKHGFVAHPAGWPLSTFRRCVRAGLYPADWAGTDTDLNAGE